MIKSKLDFRNFDYFGQIPSFNYNKSKTLTTSLGGFFTLGLAGFGIFILYFFGQELWLKQNPTVNISKVNEDHPVAAKIDFVNFDLIIRISSGIDYKNVIDNSIYTIAASMCTMGENGNLKYTPMDMVPCSVYNSTDPMLIQNYDPSNVWCISRKQSKLKPEDFAVQGIFGNKDIHLLEIQFFPCMNSSSTITCKNQSYIDSFFNGGYFGVNVFDFLIQTDNYTFPAQRVMQNYFFQISNKYSSSGSLLLNEANIQSDEGLLLQSVNTKTIIQNESFKNDLQLSALNNIIASFTIQFKNIKYIYNRNYKKIQDILAQLGGFINAITILLELIFTSYRNHVFYEEIAYKHFSFRTKKNINYGIDKLDLETKKNLNIERKDDIQQKNDAGIVLKSKTNNYLHRDDSKDYKSTPYEMKFRFHLLQKLFCLRIRNICLPSEKTSLNVFRKVSDMIEDKLDILNYLGIFYEVEKIKFVLFEKEQLEVLNIVKNSFDVNDEFKKIEELEKEKSFMNNQDISRENLKESNEIQKCINLMKEKQNDRFSSKILQLYETQ